MPTHRAHLALLRIYRHLPARLRLEVVRRITPRYTVGAITVVERADGHLLLVRHSYRRRWGFPGGLLGRGEGPRDAAVREAKEEAGLDVELLGEPAVVVEPRPRRVDVVFRGRPAAAADPAMARAASPEIVEVRWFPPTSLPSLQHEAAGALVALARTSGAAAGRSLPLAVGEDE